MPDRRLEQPDLDRLYLGDRDLVRVTIDVACSEGRLVFGSARLTSSDGSGSEELPEPELVLVGVRGFEAKPESAKPESIVLQWEVSTTSAGGSCHDGPRICGSARR